MVGVGIAGCTAASALPQELRAGRGSLGLKERLEFFQAHTLPGPEPAPVSVQVSVQLPLSCGSDCGCSHTGMGSPAVRECGQHKGRAVGVMSSNAESLDRLLPTVGAGRSPRKRTTSQCKSEPPLLRTSKRTIYTAGRPPWYNEHGTQSKEAFAIVFLLTCAALGPRSDVGRGMREGGLGGGSASGKTTVARMIIEALDVPWVVLLSMDSFYKVLTRQQQEQAAHNNFNFDHPDAFDFDLIISTLKKLKQGKSVKVPIYDFTTHSRKKDWKTLYGANVIIFEGIMAFADKTLLELLDMKIFVDTDSDIRLVRRLRRDISERGRDIEGVIKQYNKFVKPAFDQYIQPTMRVADIVVPRGSGNTVAIDLIVQHVHSQLEERLLGCLRKQGAQRCLLHSQPELGLVQGGFLMGCLRPAEYSPGGPGSPVGLWLVHFWVGVAWLAEAHGGDWLCCLVTVSVSSVSGGGEALATGLLAALALELRRRGKEELWVAGRPRSPGAASTSCHEAGPLEAFVLRKNFQGFKLEKTPPHSQLQFPFSGQPRKWYGANVIIFEGIMAFADKTLLEPTVGGRGLGRRHTFLSSPSVCVPRAALASAHQCHPLPRTLSVLKSTPQVRGMHTIIRDKETSRDEFIFYSKRLMRLLIEHALSFLPFQDCVVQTPQGQDYAGKCYAGKQITGVSILRAGETMEPALRAVCKDVRIGTILIQTNQLTGEPEVCAQDHDVPEDKIFLLSLLMAEMGVHSVAYAFPRVRIITTAVDKRVNDLFRIIPGIGSSAHEVLPLFQQQLPWGNCHSHG
ncbi:hypothetical protein CB1_000220024 [Camelus ferus]|nr:hypothetical protein CB1_000220024 [Camelus ferus]